MVEAVKRNYPQREIADAAFALQQEIDAGERIVVGVNRYVAAGRGADPHAARRPGAGTQADRPPAVRARAPRRRRGGAHAGGAARGAPPSGRNLMEPLLDCARAHASEGEIVESLQQVFGDYRETPVF